MNASSGAIATRSTQAFSAIAAAGLIAGILDITSAFIIYGAKGATPVRILQSVASGLLGPDAFNGGFGTAGLGLALHFVIALGAAAVFYAASRKLPILVEHAVASGLAYGLATYAFMNLVVLPLSAATIKYSVYSVVSQLIVHPLLVGLPIALTVRRFSRQSAVGFGLTIMNDLLNFTGKVVLVTGSSRGIGAEMIKAFGERGAHCVVNYIADSAGQNKADADAVARRAQRSARRRLRRDQTGSS